MSEALTCDSSCVNFDINYKLRYDKSIKYNQSLTLYMTCMIRAQTVGQASCSERSLSSMRRVEITANLSPKILQVLQTLLDLDLTTIEAAWSACRESGRGYFVQQIRQAPTGKVREIHTPRPAVYQVQRKILRRVLYALPISRSAYGGVPKRSHIGAARVHLEQTGEVLQTDIIDAFGQTTYGEISRVLRRALKPMMWSLALERSERKIMVGWLTHMMVISPEGGRYPRLPLGTPTSMAAFNLVWSELDAAIIALCHDLSPESPLRYTRYVDDLTFSGETPLSPELLPRLRHLLKNHRYQLNEEKTRRAPREQAIVHGLCWRDGRVDLPDPAIINLAQRAHRLNQLLVGAPTTTEWTRAAHLIKELDLLVHEIYGDAPRPQGLMIHPEVRDRVKAHQHQPARWADELWG